jgi:hypothetical protein
LSSDNIQSQPAIINALTSNQTAQQVQNAQPVDTAAVGQTLIPTKSVLTVKIQVNHHDPLFHINSKLIFCDQEIEFPKRLWILAQQIVLLISNFCHQKYKKKLK